MNWALTGGRGGSVLLVVSSWISCEFMVQLFATFVWRLLVAYCLTSLWRILTIVVYATWLHSFLYCERHVALFFYILTTFDLIGGKSLIRNETARSNTFSRKLI